ncbi:MAG: hypothetical protein C0412_21715, partial [Flavobacterium sp.]|nr:hypothetical protein [Flavobacterium sp.]
FETSNSLILWFFFLALINFYLFNQLADDKKKNNYRQKMTSIKLSSINLVFAILAVVSFLAILKNFTLLKASQAMAKARDLAEVNDLYNWQKAAPEIFKIKAPFISEQAIYVTKDLSDFDARGELNKDILTAVQADLIKIFQAEINYDRNSFVARMWLGQLYAFLGEYVDNKFFIESEKIYIEAGKINSGRQHIPMLLSKTYLLEGKDDLAIGVLTQLANNNPNLPEPHWFLGLALVKKGDTSKGLIELEKGMEFGIGFKSNIFYLIDLYSQEKMYAKIVPLYQRLIDQEPGNAKYWASLAATYQALGDLAGTMEALNKAVELDPSLKPEAEEFLKMNKIKF